MADRQAHGAESKAPPLTIERVYEAVKGVKTWRGFGEQLGLFSELAAIESQYGSNNLRVKALVEKFLRGESRRYPHPSWRVVIWALDKMNEIHLADQIIDYGEPVQDPTLVTANVAEAMQLINGWRLLGIATFTGDSVIPPRRLAVIQSKCSTKREIANECASYYVHCHPQPSWTHLARQLYGWGEVAAMEELKPFLPLRDLTITTKKLTELFATLKDDKLDSLEFWLDLPSIKTDEIERNFHSPSQRREAYLDLYATDYPIPSWSRVALALYRCDLRSQADVVKNTYVQVSERTQLNFDIAMMDGELWIRNGNMFMMGPGGSGKTCTLAAVLEEKPPSIRESTPCAKKPVRAVAQCKIGVSDEGDSKTHFVRITDEDYSDMISTSAKCIPLPTQPAPSPQLTSTQESDCNIDASPEGSFESSSSSSTVDKPVLPSWCGGSQRELLVRMNAGSMTSNQLDGKDLFDISDSGGQPMFHEVLPVFVTNTMFGMLIVKLNESLDSHPLVEYFTNGERIGNPFKSPFTHLQTFRHCMRVLQSTCERGKCPKIAFIGTHRDLEKDCPSEDRKEKNRKLLSIVPPQMKDSVISCTSESLLFAINAICPGDDDQSVLMKLRKLLLSELLKIPRVRIPLRYFGLEMAFQRLAKYQKKAILSKEECFKEATTFHFTRESFEDALKYLKGIKLVMYYEDILPKVVFVDAQVLLDKITELVEHSLLVQSESSRPDSQAGSVDSFEKFKHGIVTKEILSHFKSHYVPNLFLEDHLILVFKHLLIVAEVGEDEYLMPCLLKQEAIPRPLTDSLSQVVSPLLFYFGKDGPKLGVYCFLLSSLITEAKWELLMDKGCPVQLSRNRVHFKVPDKQPGFITITDSFSTFFHVAITFPSDIDSDTALKICADICPTIRETILAGIRKASRTLNYNNSIPESAFLCSKHQDDSLHPAIISKHDILTCTSQPGSIINKMTESHKLWFGKDHSDSTPEAQSASQSTAASPSIRFAMDATPTLGKLSVLRTAEGQKIKVIESVAPLWQSLGDLLEFDSSGSKLRLIKATHPDDPKACCRDMFRHWLIGNGVRPCSWRKLIELLEDCDLDDLAAGVRSACSS